MGMISAPGWFMEAIGAVVHLPTTVAAATAYLMDITFYGAAREVTGSCHLIRCRDQRILFDCGMRQGAREADKKNRRKFPFKIGQLDAVVLSHAHLDHCGLLPKLVGAGYAGPIYATSATIALAEIILRDSAHIQEMDAQRETRWNARKGKPAVLPNYTTGEVERTLPLFRPVPYGKDTQPVEGFNFRFHDAGHILGSAITEFEIGEGGNMRRLVMSGDIGPNEQALMRNPETLEHAHALVMESTYGDRDHRPKAETLAEFEQVIQNAHKSGGHVIVPAFAVGRTQSLIYRLAEMDRAHRLPFREVYIDSPMALTTTGLYCRTTRLFDEEALALIAEGFELCKLDFVHFTRDVEDSKGLNDLKRPAIIIAASGMCTGGRVLHHLKHNLWRPEAHVMFVGYQGRGTLGRQLVDGAKSVRIYGEQIAVKAQIHTINGFSAHAGRSELLDWHDHFTKGNPQTVLVHGEENAMSSLADAIETRRHARPAMPKEGEAISFGRD